jgi:hypothetical protein
MNNVVTQKMMNNMRAKKTHQNKKKTTIAFATAHK